MVLALLFGCRDEIHLEDAGLTKLNNVVSSGHFLLSFSPVLCLTCVFFLCFGLALYILKYYGGFDTIPVKLYLLTHWGFMISLLKEIIKFCFLN